MHKAGPGFYELTVSNMPCKTEVEQRYKQAQIIAVAIRFVEVALHETAHVFQGRNNLGLKCPKTSSGRRIAWAKRPAEIDAENREYEVLQSPVNKVRADDLALALAIAMEETI
jgi:hypothetical protein